MYLTALGVFEHLFREYGLPKRIRSDNGVPFASAHALHGLSRLAVWWLRLGIEIERIKPGNPQKMEDMSVCTECSSKPLQGRQRAICFSSKISLRALCKSTTSNGPMKAYK